MAKCEDWKRKSISRSAKIIFDFYVGIFVINLSYLLDVKQSNWCEYIVKKIGVCHFWYWSSWSHYWYRWNVFTLLCNSFFDVFRMQTLFVNVRYMYFTRKCFLIYAQTMSSHIRILVQLLCLSNNKIKRKIFQFFKCHIKRLLISNIFLW